MRMNNLQVMYSRKSAIFFYIRKRDVWSRGRQIRKEEIILYHALHGGNICIQGDCLSKLK